MLYFFDTCSIIVCLSFAEGSLFLYADLFRQRLGSAQTRKLLKKFDQNFNMLDLLDFEYKMDSEIKILIGCTEEEKKIVYQCHNDSNSMKGIMIRKNYD